LFEPEVACAQGWRVPIARPEPALPLRLAGEGARPILIDLKKFDQIDEIDSATTLAK